MRRKDLPRSHNHLETEPRLETQIFLGHSKLPVILAKWNCASNHTSTRWRQSTWTEAKQLAGSPSQSLSAFPWRPHVGPADPGPSRHLSVEGWPAHFLYVSKVPCNSTSLADFDVCKGKPEFLPPQEPIWNGIPLPCFFFTFLWKSELCLIKWHGRPKNFDNQLEIFSPQS